MMSAALPDAEHRRQALRQALEFTRMTVVGGALFLLPVFIVILVLAKVLKMVGVLTAPLVKILGVTSIMGIAVGNLVTVFAVIVLAFLAGLFARTAMGQHALTWIQDGVSATLPQFSMIQGVARTFGPAPAYEGAEMPVVLVRADAGLALGLLLETEGDWHAVYIPGAPQMSAGSVAYAHTNEIHRTDLTLKQLWTALRSRGKGSAEVYKQLTRLQAAGKLSPE